MSASGPPFRCADAARDRGDSLHGTAPQTSRWLLVEHRGPWPVNALAGTGWPLDLLRRLDTGAYAVGGRILLVRRPGRVDRAAVDLSWAVVVGGHGTLWGRWREPEDLLAALDVLVSGEVPRGDDPLLLVCTHGVHDVCCALRGRPVAAALDAVRPGAVWECSHLGGDRFAANLIVLPDGVYYGNLDPASAVAVVAAHEAGAIDLDHLRGIARHPPIAQVAVAAVHRRWGPYASEDVLVTAVAEAGTDLWRVGLHVPSVGPATATVRTDHQARAQLTCRAARATSATTYTVVDLTRD